MNLKNIGNNIKQLRSFKQLTQAQLAEKANISTVHMSHIETGTVAMSLESLLNISNALDTTPDVLLMGEYQQSSLRITDLINIETQDLTYDENKLIFEITKTLKTLKVNRN